MYKKELKIRSLKIHSTYDQVFIFSIEKVHLNGWENIRVPTAKWAQGVNKNISQKEKSFKHSNKEIQINIAKIPFFTFAKLSQ